MSSNPAGRAWRWLLLAFPRQFRRRHGLDLLDLVSDLVAEGRSRRSLAFDLAAQGLGARLRLRQPRPYSTRSPDSRSSLMDRLLQDVRYGLRSLVSNPGVTLVVTLTLGLGIGANTAIFAVINTVLLQPLPFDGAERVFQVYETNQQRGIDGSNVSYPNLEDLITRSEQIEAGGALSFTNVNLAAGDYPERVRAALVSGELFDVLGMTTLAGRPLGVADQDPGAESRVVVSEGFWQQRLGADPGAVGSRLRVNGRPRTVVGVVSELPLADVEVFLPLRLDEYAHRTNHFLQGLVRAAPGVTPEQLRASATGISEGLRSEYPEAYEGWGFRLVELQMALVDDGWVILVFLLGIVAVVLLIACANVTNVLLARAAARSREIAVRSALGAGRARIFRQLLTESLMLAMCGGLAGLLFGFLGLGILRSNLPEDIPRTDEVTLDPTVLAVTLGIALLTGILFGLAPALSASRSRLSETLKEGGAQMSTGWARGRLRSGLVIAEVCASVALLMVAGLLVRTLLDVTARDPGFSVERMLALRLDPPAQKYPEAVLDEFTRRLQADVSRVPGVEAAALTSQIPRASSRTYRGFKIEGAPSPPVEQIDYANWVSVTPGYFETLRMNLLAGRFFDARDGADAEPTIILNRSMARTLFGQQPAIGRRVHIFTDEELAREVVGVIGDVVDRPFNEKIDPQFFTPLPQAYSNRLSLVVRTDSEAATVVSAVRDLLRRIDPDLPVYGVQTLQEVLAGSVAGPRVITAMVGAFAMLALGLSVLGLYGVIAYAVTRRTREIGIRIALGADAGQVRRMVVGEGLRLAAIAAPLGVGIALVFLQVISSQFRRIEVFDPLTVAAVVGLTVVAVLAASYVPARRATRVDPLVALRAE